MGRMGWAAMGLIAALAMASCSPAEVDQAKEAALQAASDKAAEMAKDEAGKAAEKALASLGGDEEKRPASHKLVGQKIPDFSAPLVGGGTLTDESLKGKWTVLEFWGLWCPDCMADSQNVAALNSAIAQDPSLRFATVHVENRFGKYSSVEQFFAEKGYSYPVAMDPDKKLYEAFQMEWVPTYLVIDPEGVVRGFRTDMSQDKSPEGGVKSFLKQIAEIKKAAAQPAAPPAKP